MENSAELHPVFVVGGLYSLANGVAWIMRDLAAALGRQGSPVTVCAADCWGRGAASIGHIFEEPSRWVSSRGLWLGGLSWAPSLKRKMTIVINSADIVHNHSLWMLPNSYGSRIAERTNNPVVISAHGALEPWAVKNAGWKKRIVGGLFQNRDLRRADCLHVNSQAEVDGIRRYGVRCPVAVIPNGIHLPDYANLPAPDVFHEAFPATSGRRMALFMGRLHPKKGLAHLVHAWNELHREFNDWQLVIAGPDDGYESTLRQLLRELDLAEDVCLTGALHEERKRAALSAADVFLCPSFSEGFSMSILEALACQLPVLMTPGCNFSEAAQRGAAIEVTPDVTGTMDGLRRLLCAPDRELAEMGKRGRRLIEEKYQWDHVAEQTLRLYRWLQTGRDEPEFIVHGD